jgi:hypothetical protein
VALRFEELDWQETPMGDLFLRRRVEPTLGVDVYEVKLGDEYLMSSLFTEAEEQLSHLGLAPLSGGNLSVLVGGLGLGYTAIAALSHDSVGSLTVVDASPPSSTGTSATCCRCRRSSRATRAPGSCSTTSSP